MEVIKSRFITDKTSLFQHSTGFALPTILIASIIMLTVLLVSITSTVAVRTALQTQYYNQIAQTAADAGLVYAKSCLKANGNVPQWSDAKPLTPVTDCTGTVLGSSADVQVLVVGGGGGGGGNCSSCGGAGGGGAGGLIYTPSYNVSVGSTTVVVATGGAGGAKANSSSGNGANGNDSSFGSIVALGGGGGRPQSGVAGASGGSGGGGSGGSSPAPGAGGAGTAGQGNNGGAGVPNGGAGGGGAGGIGGGGGTTAGGAGGLGIAYSITGSSVYYAGGGGGGGASNGTPGVGGSGSGGNGANQSTNGGNGYPGAANTGGGGGGASGTTTGGVGGGGAGGVVIISYPTGTLTATGGTKTTSGGNTIHRFISNGTFTVSSIPTPSCPDDPICSISSSDNMRTSFSVKKPSVNGSGQATNIVSNGTLDVLRSSTQTVWRTYQQTKAEAAPPVITNMITNPSAESSLSDTTGNGITLTRSAAWASSGSYSFSLVPNAATIDTFLAIGGATSTGLRLGLTPGHTYTLSAVLRIPSTLTGSLDGRAACITAYQKINSVYTSDRSCASTSAGTYPLRLTFTVDPTATDASIRLYHGGSSGSGTVYYDSVMLVEGSVGYSYSDGSMDGWSWNGTVGASTSSGVAS